MRQKLKKIWNSFLFFLELQLLISVVMLPILIAWGLSTSVMTIVGNLVFAQFLTAFIFVSAVIFTFDIFKIPNTYAIISLEWITTTWDYFLSFGSINWLIGYPKYLFPLSAIAAIAACTLYYKKKSTQYQRILFLTGLYLSIPIAKVTWKKKYTHCVIMQGNQNFYIIEKDGVIYAFDCGALGARPSSQSWIEYTLTSHMIKSFGVNHIDMLFLCKSNSRTPQAVRTLTEYIPVKGTVLVS